MRSLTYIVFIVLFLSCGKEEVNDDPNGALIEQEHQGDWRTNSSFGYYKEKMVNGFQVGVTYLPESSQLNDVENQSVHFLLSITTDGEKNEGNFLYKDVATKEDFASNVNYFNFHIQEDVQIYVDGNPYTVALTNMENTYTLDDIRKIHFVAVPQKSSSVIAAEPGQSVEKMEFIYDDSTLGIGYTKFTFETKKFKSISNKSAQ